MGNMDWLWISFGIGGYATINQFFFSLTERKRKDRMLGKKKKATFTVICNTCNNQVSPPSSLNDAKKFIADNNLPNLKSMEKDFSVGGNNFFLYCVCHPCLNRGTYRATMTDGKCNECEQTPISKCFFCANCKKYKCISCGSSFCRSKRSKWDILCADCCDFEISTSKSIEMTSGNTITFHCFDSKSANPPSRSFGSLKFKLHSFKTCFDIFIKSDKDIDQKFEELFRTQPFIAKNLKDTYSGEKYTGYMRAGRRHGRGRLAFPNGTIYEGRWENDYRKMTIDDVLVYANGDSYKGGMNIKYQRSGRGTYFFGFDASSHGSFFDCDDGNDDDDDDDGDNGNNVGDDGNVNTEIKEDNNIQDGVLNANDNDDNGGGGGDNGIQNVSKTGTTKVQSHSIGDELDQKKEGEKESSGVTGDTIDELTPSILVPSLSSFGNMDSIALSRRSRRTVRRTISPTSSPVLSASTSPTLSTSPDVFSSKKGMQDIPSPVSIASERSKGSLEQLLSKEFEMPQQIPNTKRSFGKIQIPNDVCFFTCDWKDDNIADGVFELNYVYNNGTMVFNGKCEFVDKVFKGTGIVEYEDGSRYEGQWVQEKRHGFGKYISKDGDVYEGDWSNDVKHGRGVETYENGGSYHGTWKHDKKHGCFEFHWPDGVITHREYIHDQLIIERNFTLPRSICTTTES